ncbi:MAG TPA: hydroxyphenylacetyl-CoA thioesterase PaaI [Burkholderiales bacterium]|nr:hydroxyphenylacetyl-CoA thioesterase PaaI [Burkholderiales bacterium]
MSPEEIAQRSAELIERDDRASRWLGMTLEEVRPGYARLAMPVAEHMLNAQSVCHGGLVFALADSSFGYACNTHNQRALAASCAIEFLAPAHAGDRLTAEAAEVARSGRSSVYDVRVTNQHRRTIALFRGKAVSVKEAWLE